MHGQKLHASAALFNSWRWLWSQEATITACVFRGMVKVDSRCYGIGEVHIGNSFMIIFYDLYLTWFTNDLCNFLLH